MVYTYVVCGIQSVPALTGTVRMLNGTGITKILPPVSRFVVEGGHAEKKQHVIDKLQVFFDRFFSLASYEGQD